MEVPGGELPVRFSSHQSQVSGRLQDVGDELDHLLGRNGPLWFAAVEGTFGDVSFVSVGFNRAGTRDGGLQAEREQSHQSPEALLVQTEPGRGTRR